jgi:hypothetical protein
VRRLPALLACVAVLAAAGCGGGSGSGVHSNIPSDLSVEVDLTKVVFVDGRGFQRQTTVFSLKCNPPEGSLPLAARVCGDIERHPQAMMDPLTGRTLCRATGGAAAVLVLTKHNGKTTTWGGIPTCRYQGSGMLGVYLDAAQDNPEDMSLWESALHCDEDPTLRKLPKGSLRLQLCEASGSPAGQQGLLIDWARSTFGYLPNISNVTLVFPNTPGAARCDAGECGVSIQKAASGHPGVTFRLTWRQGGQTLRHTWYVDLDVAANAAKLVRETGPLPKSMQ